MVTKSYNWAEGADLDEHSKTKHSIVRQYFRQYLITRCKLPQREKFRLAIVDGFSGGGLYKNGEYGSPIIFIDTLISTTNEMNIHRASQGMKPIDVECLLIFNDYEEQAIKQLQQNVTPHLLRAKDECKNLYLKDEYHSEKFEDIYPEIKQRLISAKCSNVLFNLDQCGYSHVKSSTLRDIVNSWRSSEVILTFMIESMLAYLSPDDEKSGATLEPELQGKVSSILRESSTLSKPQWLGEVEQIVHVYFRGCAKHVSPFSINNPSGWRYWLMHFANSYRARQVYNDILHQQEGALQAHFGRSGLKMLSYDPREEGQLYLFNKNSRESAKEELYEDIPRLIAESGDALPIHSFYEAAYNETPAHSDDIHEMMIENPDVEIITESGGERRKPNTIRPEDTIKLRSQKSMFFMFPDRK